MRWPIQAAICWIAGAKCTNVGASWPMKRRIWSSVALVAVLFCFLTRPICRDGFAASLGTRSGWTCVANDN